MIIDLKNITEELLVKKALDRDWWVVQDEDDQILGLETPLELDIKVSRAGEKYLIKGEIAGGVRVRCDRCLEPFRWDFKSAFSVYLVVPEPTTDQADIELLEEEMEVDFTEGEAVELDQIIKEQVYLSLPMKCICKDDCLGLCPGCGVNLNREACQCKQETGHPAFSKLQSLMENRG
ncbi:MAG: hypothetical protein DRH11_02215 [Deltaproteobacteria bacterium]|nr:MAG: hypothetical protein DRH11_02215 [Deltaproteobacteria bacterium]